MQVSGRKRRCRPSSMRSGPRPSLCYSCWLLLLGARRRRADALAQFNHPTGHLLVLAGDFEVALILLECFLRLREIKIVEHASVQMGRRVIWFSGNSAQVSGFSVGKFAELSLDDSKLIAGHRIARRRL